MNQQLQHPKAFAHYIQKLGQNQLTPAHILELEQDIDCYDEQDKVFLINILNKQIRIHKWGKVGEEIQKSGILQGYQPIMSAREAKRTFQCTTKHAML